MIEIKNVSKNFGTQAVLKDVSLQVDRQTIGLLGVNGAGKTTLLKCILNLLDFRGSISVAGLDVKRDALAIKKRIGYIPQQFPIWSDMSVGEVMKFGAELRGVDSQRQVMMLEEFGLIDHAKKAVAALSGGMRQKLSIAIALLSDPEVLLLDEPTASLDAWATKEILGILESWKGKRTVILSSHRLEEVQAVAHRFIHIKNGTLKEGSLT